MNKEEKAKKIAITLYPSTIDQIVNITQKLEKLDPCNQHSVSSTIRRAVYELHRTMEAKQGR